MGNILTLLRKKNKLNTVYITEDIIEQKANQPLPKTLFTDLEIVTLKEFCHDKNLSQSQINYFYKNLIQLDPSKLKINLIRCSQIKQRFKSYSLLNRELVDIFIPPIYYRNYIGLDLPYLKNEEVSLSRFVIMSYVFGGQHILDTVYDFIAMLMQNMAIKLSASILSYNFEKIILVLIDNDDTTRKINSPINNVIDCGYSDVTLRILKPLLNPKNDTEITVEKILKLSIKYPILFYQLAKFQKIFRHKIFGDLYWNRQNLPLSLRLENFDISNISCDILDVYSSELNAIRHSAR